MPHPPDLQGAFFIGASMSVPAEIPYLEKLDERQKAAATAERNCVVTAGAGAGKTTVLASRFIHLVIGKAIPVRSILALTFTRKAAAEMYERIYGKLAAQTSAWAREQLDDFRNTHITTLDSFCAEIVKQAARDFGYSPEFSIDSEKCGDLARGIAWRYVYRNRGKPGIREMLMSFPFEDVAARLFGDLGAGYVTPLALKGKLFSPMKGALEKMASEKAGAAFDRLSFLAREILAFPAGTIAPRTDCAAALACSATLLETGENYRNKPLLLSDFKEHFFAFSGLAMRSYGKSEYEGTIKALAKEARSTAKNLLDFSEYMAMLPSHFFLLDRLDEFASEVAEAKRLANLMDFKDLGACAVRILEHRKDIRTFWKKTIESIMIDEFQDNNDLQKDLLYLLAEKNDRNVEGIPAPGDLEEGKLFFVGDEKQSIYRFRGADVAVFKRLAGELSDSPSAKSSADIVLSANYRSSGSLIDFFNDFFASMLKENPEGKPRDFCAAYSDMKPGFPASPEERGFDSKVGYYIVEAAEEEIESGDESARDDEPDPGISTPAEGMPGTTPLGADDSLAFEIAQFIKRARGTLDLREVQRGESEEIAWKADYGDFAILLRTTTQQHRLEKYLRLLDIPFDSESPRSLFRESPANDIYNMLAFMLDPGNKAAYAAVLRSPLCRISDDALLHLLTSAGKAFEWESASEYDAAMLDRAKAFFSSLRKLAASASVSDIVEYVWNAGGLRLDILSRPESHSFLEHFDYLYHIAAGIDQDHGGIAEFLARLRPCVEEESEKFDIENVPRASVSGVKILTIHKSKGLQFPIVIIPWVENSGSVKRSQVLWEMLPEGLVVDIKPFDKPGAKADNIFFRLAKDLENEMNVAEIKRLLYVACTRAEDHLFFFGKKRKRGDTVGHSFQYYLEEYSALHDSLSILEITALSLKTLDDVRRWYGKPGKPPAGDFALAYARAKTIDRHFPRRHLSATELNESFRGKTAPTLPATIGFPPADMDLLLSIPADTFGTLCHDAVEKAMETGSTEGYIPSADITRGMDPGSLARATRLATSMAQGFLESDFWKSLPPAVEIQSEKPFILRLGEFMIKGRMDLFIETDDELTILDFKSDTEQDASGYAVQMDLYRRAAEGISPGKQVRIGLFWLRTSTLAWQEGKISDEVLLDLALDAAGSIGHELA